MGRRRLYESDECSVIREASLTAVFGNSLISMTILRSLRTSFVLGAAISAACATGAGPAPASTPAMSFSASDQRELLPDEQVQRVLNRLAFGARPGDAAAVRAMGVDKWIARQLQPEQIDDANATTLVARYPALTSDRAALVADFTEAR